MTLDTYTRIVNLINANTSGTSGFDLISELSEIYQETIWKAMNSAPRDGTVIDMVCEPHFDSDIKIKRKVCCGYWVEHGYWGEYSERWMVFDDDYYIPICWRHRPKLPDPNLNF